jgi:hypothetical protein
MRQFRSISIATFLLLGLAGVALAAGIREDRAAVRQQGRVAIVTAEYALAMDLGR